jgi:hypothetical protein
MNRSKRLLIASIAVFGGLPFGANATVFTPNVGETATVTYFNESTNAVVSSACSQGSTVPGTTVGCTGTSTTPTAGSTLSYSDTATADYGVLKAGGTSTISGANGVPNTTDDAATVGQAFFEDAWTLTGGTGTGTLQLLFHLDGSYNFCSAGAQEGFSLIPLNGTGGSSSSVNLVSGCSNTIAETAVLTTTFTFGSPLDFLVTLEAGSVQFNLGQNGTSFFDLQDTATMTSIVVDNSAGAPIPFDLSTASGAPLFSELAPSAPTSVPEPASLALFAPALLGLGFLVRRRDDPASQRSRRSA